MAALITACVTTIGMIAGLLVFRQRQQPDTSGHGTAALSCNRQQHGLDRRFKEIRLMSLQPLYRPLRPELDKFLYAAVGEERGPVTLTMLSA